MSVIIKGTTAGTATDADGRYTLNVAGPGATLQFKYLGYVSAEQAVGHRSRAGRGPDRGQQAAGRSDGNGPGHLA